MVVEEWLAESFPFQIDQSTNTTKFTSCASPWDALIQVQVQVYISNKKSLTRPAAGLESVAYYGTSTPSQSAVTKCHIMPAKHARVKWPNYNVCLHQLDTFQLLIV